ncbi:DUF3955 domain-containing protein [Streptomyces sp. NPDC048639]|uniref:DUF3955 domain-containing protein n=1 Tax=Streptomyces sp. NPDC048639 TaxID=3365581 RepID=UPI003713C618
MRPRDGEKLHEGGSRMDGTFLQMALLACVAVTLGTATWKAVKGMSHRSAWRVSAALLWAGALSFVVNIASGSSVDDNGVLHEQFALVPVGWALLLVGTVSALITGWRGLPHRS